VSILGFFKNQQVKTGGVNKKRVWLYPFPRPSPSSRGGWQGCNPSLALQKAYLDIFWKTKTIPLKTKEEDMKLKLAITVLSLVLLETTAQAKVVREGQNPHLPWRR
jgi:hypothetical protein